MTANARDISARLSSYLDYFMDMSRFTIALLLLLSSFSASAEVLVLIHGYLGSDRSWIERGIVSILESRGHQYVGSYMYGPQGILFASIGKPGDRPMYTVNLPSTAPVPVQAGWLAAYLDDIVKHNPDQPITLAAHSAGGVVARYVLVTHAEPAVTRLITIATPHLGTGRALQALHATGGGGLFSGLRHWATRHRIGDYYYDRLRQSRGILFDLTPPRPGNLLYWLNNQPHPPIDYTSIIRTGTYRMPGDQFVPPISEDMRLVPAIGDRAKSYVMAQGHMLTRQDGYLLANLLDGIEQIPEQPKAAAGKP